PGASRAGNEGHHIPGCAAARRPWAEEFNPFGVKLAVAAMRVLLAPLGSHGDVHPFLGLGLALRARGHDVHVITSEAFRGLIERHGFPFAPVGTEADFEAMIHHPDMWHPGRSIRALLGQTE